jgi:hypothetical protein
MLVEAPPCDQSPRQGYVATRMARPTFNVSDHYRTLTEHEGQQPVRLRVANSNTDAVLPEGGHRSHGRRRHLGRARVIGRRNVEEHRYGTTPEAPTRSSPVLRQPDDEAEVAPAAETSLNAGVG